MINASGYTIHRRGKNGVKSDVIFDYTSLDLNLNWGKESKFTIKGTNVSGSPISKGDFILIYRDEVLLYSGYVNKVIEECTTDGDATIQWTASGTDDESILNWRLVLPDPIDITFNENISDVKEDYQSNAIAYYIDRNCGISAKAARRMLTVEPVGEIGEITKNSLRLKKLGEACEDIGKSSNLYPKLNWNPDTGRMTVGLVQQRDVSEKVVFSPEFGNVTKWKKTAVPPTYNAVWVASGKASTGRVVVYAQDDESVKKYGRIEGYESYEDVKITEEETEETITETHLNQTEIEIGVYASVKIKLLFPSEKEAGYSYVWGVDTNRYIELDTSNGTSAVIKALLPGVTVITVKCAQVLYNEEGEVIDNYGPWTCAVTVSVNHVDTTLKEYDVQKILETNAKKLLQENSANEKYSVTISQTEDCQFVKDWQIGDIVTIVIQGKKFTSTINSIAIHYGSGVEKITPTVGEVELGVFGELITMIKKIDNRLSAGEAV